MKRKKKSKISEKDIIENEDSKDIKLVKILNSDFYARLFYYFYLKLEKSERIITTNEVHKKFLIARNTAWYYLEVFNNLGVLKNRKTLQRNEYIIVPFKVKEYVKYAEETVKNWLKKKK